MYIHTHIRIDICITPTPALPLSFNRAASADSNEKDGDNAAKRQDTLAPHQLRSVHSAFECTGRGRQMAKCLVK